MGNIVNVPGEGPVDFGDMSDAQVREVLNKKFGPPKTNAGRSRETDEPPEPTGPPPDQYGVHDVGGTVTEGRHMPALTFADDVVRRVANAATFGLADKAAAKADEVILNKGTYDENLPKERQKTEATTDRLGLPMSILADVGGGAATGAGLARQGISLLSGLPRSASLIQKILAGGAEGGLYGAASGAGHTDSDDPGDYAQNAWQGAKTGAVVGAAVPAVAGGVQRVVTPFPADAPRRALVEGLRDEGVTNVTAGQATGNPVLRYFEDVFAKLPLGGNPARGQMEQVTQAAMRRAGLQGTHATSDVLDDGFNKIGGEIGALQRQYPIQFNNRLIHDLGQVQNSASILSRDDQGVINAFTNRVLQPGATLDPLAMQALRTDLRLALTKGANERPLFNRAITNLRDAIDDGLDRTIVNAGNPADAARLADLRQQYANLHVLTDAINRSGASGEHGVLTPQALKGSLSASIGKTNYARGGGDNSELAKGSAGILTSPPESGTATRFNLLEPHRAVMGPVGRTLLNNPVMQRYWGNQVAPNAMPPGLLQPGVTGAAAGATAPGPADRLMGGLLMGGP